ncbi:MAG: hypothetical protein ACFFDI_31355 [Promethearchaeota archaeon]
MVNQDVIEQNALGFPSIYENGLFKEASKIISHKTSLPDISCFTSSFLDDSNSIPE